MGNLIAALILSGMINGVTIADDKMDHQWVDLGECRITCYCPECNDGAGHESSSGKYLEYGDCACSWLPVGTKINIEGEEFTVVDVCGTDAIDVFIDTEECCCNLNEYRHVVMEVDQ